MFACSPPSADFSAGAITSANRIGVSIGTAIWRGLWAVSAARRDASVRSARLRRVRGGAGMRALSGAGGATVVAMVVSFRGRDSGGDEAVAGQAQVDVVEGRPAAGDRARGDPGPVERADRLAGAQLVQRDGEGLADDVAAGGRDAVGAEHGERGLRVAVDAQLEQLAAEAGEQ